MKALWALYFAVGVIYLAYMTYLAMKVTAIFALVAVVLVFWAILGWKIRKIVKRRS